MDSPVPRSPSTYLERLKVVKPSEIDKLTEKDLYGSDFQKLLKPVVHGESGKAVLREDLETYLQHQVDQDKRCRKIPFMVCYFVFFDLMLIMHEHFSNASQVERQLRSMATGSSFEGYEAGGPGSERIAVSGHKVFSDLDTAEDIYTMLREALVPQLIPSAEDVSVDAANRIWRYHRLIGGVVLEQTRRGKENCASLYPRMGPKNDFRLNPFLIDFSCYRDVPNDAACFGPGEATEGFCSNGTGTPNSGRRLRRGDGWESDNLASLDIRLAASVTPEGPRFTVILQEQRGTEAALQQVRQLEEASWIDEQTAWVGLKFFMVNPDLAIYSFTRINAYFLLSGELIPILEVTTFVAEPYQFTSTLVVDIIWGLMLLELVLSCLWELVQALGKRRQGLRAYFFNFWVWVDWGCAAMGLAVVVCWIVYMNKLETLKLASMNVAVARPDMASGASTDPAVLQDYRGWVQNVHTSVGTLSSYLSFLRFFLSCYNICLIARFFEAFQTQPRLAIVTNTLLQSLPDFLHFMIVFVTMILTYAMAATFLFGQRLPEYSELHLSLERCLLMIFGAIDYQKLSAEYPIAAFVWFVSFILLLFLIMVNMSLAVIIDVYAGQIGTLEVSDSLWSQVRNCRRRNALPAKKLLQEVEEIETTMVTQSDLRLLFPHIDKRVIRNVIETVRATVDSEYKHATSVTDATRLVVVMKRHVQGVASNLNALINSQHMTLAKMREALDSFAAGKPGEGRAVLDSKAQRRLKEIEHRLDLLEGLMDDALQYVENRGRGLRDRLKVIEDQLRGHRDGGS